MILDCENLESTIKSLCNAYEVDERKLKGFLKACDLYKIFEEDDVNKECAQYLKDLFELKFGISKKKIRFVCLFHLTRVKKNTDFAAGILPLSKILTHIWDTILESVQSTSKKKKLLKIKKNRVKHFQYELKTSSQLNDGPYAILVKESAFHAKSIGNHDYLKVPEIFEDICNAYFDEFGENILKEVINNLHKCIVKFKTSTPVCEDLLAPALFYCWCKINNNNLSFESNDCIDFEGNVIPYESIINIEYI